MWVLSLTGSLEDWDAAVQKTGTKLNRVNEQRARVSPITSLFGIFHKLIMFDASAKKPTM